MSGKVLGFISKENAKVLLRLFREQQAKRNSRSGCYCSECEHDMRLAMQEFYKLVPVVSLEELKRWVKSNAHWKKDFAFVWIGDLLNWAEKEAGG